MWNRRFGIIRPILKGQSVQPLKMKPLGSPKTSVLNHLNPRNNPKNGRIHS
jgi:hypothetical protein